MISTYFHEFCGAGFSASQGVVQRCTEPISICRILRSDGDVSAKGEGVLSHSLRPASVLSLTLSYLSPPSTPSR